MPILTEAYGGWLCSQRFAPLAHTRQPLFRPKLRQLGRQLTRRVSQKQPRLAISALQPRDGIELPEGMLYKTSLLTYKVTVRTRLGSLQATPAEGKLIWYCWSR